MKLLDSRSHAVCRELDVVNDRIIALLSERVEFWQRLAIRDIGRAWFYRELCVWQQKTIAEERARNVKHRQTIAALREELQCRMAVPKP